MGAGASKGGAVMKMKSPRPAHGPHPGKPAIGLVPHPIKVGCTVADILQRLLNENALPLFLKEWNDTKNCHEIALCLQLELKLRHRISWEWWTGYCESFGSDHSWLEHDDWAIDASNGGRGRPIIIMPRNMMRAQMTNIRKSTAGGEA